MMNERLKELAREAELLVYNPNGVPTKLEKFAELIVRECVEVSINNGCGDFVDIEQKLFKHFGVSDDK
jgi:hypothetical protein